MSLHALAFLLFLAAPPAPDTLVVCPAEFRPALVPWEQFRRQQGHAILVVDPPGNVARLSATIHSVANQGRLKYVVLVGDVPIASDDPQQARARSVPTNYVPAKINTRWGSEPTIATDVPFADLDGDDRPDIAVGRIPADTPQELAAVVRKIIRYEQQVEHGAWERRLNVVAGVGGFGAVTDAIIEAAGRQVIQQIVPRDYEILQTSANPRNPACPPPGEFGSHVRRQLSEGSLAWIYLGHGQPTELDRVPSPMGDTPILSVEDVPQLSCGSQSPLAVLVACYTGACDASRDCLGEELALADEGPVAVIAATRVTMPYGNTVYGYELLRACFRDRPAALGDMIRLAQSRTLSDAADDSLRTSLDAMAGGISPPPVDLAGERREHVWMYHLYGDPLLRLRLPPTNVAAASGETTVVK